MPIFHSTHLSPLLMDNDLYKVALSKNPFGCLILHFEDASRPESIQQVTANKAACTATRVNMEQANGRLWSDAYPELAGSELARQFALAARSGKPVDFNINYQDSLFPQAWWKGTAWLISGQTVSVSFTIETNGQSGKTLDQLYAMSKKQAIQDQHDLNSINEELLAFNYAVSHDLRAPLRRIDGFSQELLNSYADKLDHTGKHYLNRIRNSAQNMGRLIDDLLKLSRISRQITTIAPVDLGTPGLQIIDELRESEPQRKVLFETSGDLTTYADAGLMRVMLYNLISNAWKFSGNVNQAIITLGSTLKDGQQVFYVSDNGAGFDMKYVDKLFHAFQRLHSPKDFEGTGMGLATVKRIITLHLGDVWADSIPGKGTTINFTLNAQQPPAHEK